MKVVIWRGRRGAAPPSDHEQARCTCGEADLGQGHFMKHSHAQSVPAREPNPTPGTVIPRRRRGIPTQQRR